VNGNKVFSSATFENFKTAPEPDKQQYTFFVSDVAMTYFMKRTSETPEEISKAKQDKATIINKYKPLVNPLIKKDLEQGKNVPIAEKYNKYLSRFLGMLTYHDIRNRQVYMLFYLAYKFTKISVLLPLDVQNANSEQKLNKLAAEQEILHEMINIGKNVIRLVINHTKQVDLSRSVNPISQRNSRNNR
jgi:hypothetical protein